MNWKDIKNLIKDIDKNLILIGDFNMTNISKRFISFLEETNLYTYTSYIQPTFTWPAYLPSYFGIQIDHVLFSENIKNCRNPRPNTYNNLATRLGNPSAKKQKSSMSTELSCPSAKNKTKRKHHNGKK